MLSTTLEKAEWQTTRIIGDADEIRDMKEQQGGDMVVLGGATTVSSLINLGLIDELRLLVNPLLLGGGKALFKDVDARRALRLLRAKPTRSGKVSLVYSTRQD